jgi:uncharacterized membrane protein YhhN
MGGGRAIGVISLGLPNLELFGRLLLGSSCGQSPTGTCFPRRVLGSVRLTRPAALWLAGYGLVSLVNVTAELLGVDALSVGSLFFAMPSLIGVVLASGTVRARLGPIVAALLFSWLGDWVGDLSNTILTKIGFFLAAQACYTAAFWPLRASSLLRRRGWTAAYALTVGGALAWAATAAGAMAPAVAVYGCAVGLMVALATGVHPLTAVGAGSFLISDFLIGLTTFVAPGAYPRAGVLIKASYLIGQLLMVSGIVAQPAPSTLGVGRRDAAGRRRWTRSRGRSASR